MLEHSGGLLFYPIGRIQRQAYWKRGGARSDGSAKREQEEHSSQANRETLQNIVNYYKME